MSTVAVTADRRLKRNARPGQRTRRSSAKRWLLWGAGVAGLCVVVVGLALAARAVVRAETFRVTSVVIAGQSHVSEQQRQELVGMLRGRSIFTIDLAAVRVHWEASPWVREARLRRVLPSTVEVRVTERQAVAVGRLGVQLFVIDERGTLIDAYGPSYASLHLPIVDGFEGVSAAAASEHDAARASLAARVVLDLQHKPQLLERLSQLDVSDPRNAQVLLNGDPAQLRLGNERFLARTESYLSVASALRDRLGNIDYVDLRYDGRLFVKPAGADATPVAVDAAASPGM